MKKIVTLALLFAGAFTSAAYAQGNLFTPADCDANGWLWFDTQAKIDKYVGDANSDKIIKMVPTKYQVEVEPDIFENLKNTASPTVYGAGTDGYLPGVDSTGATLGADAKQGAIVLAPATNAIMAMNGGGILMHLQSCYSLNMFFSCEGHIKPVLQGVDGTKETIDLFSEDSGNAVYNVPMGVLMPGWKSAFLAAADAFVSRHALALLALNLLSLPGAR